MARRLAGWGVSTELPDMDFETYSDLDIGVVGAAKYATHPSTEVLSLAYDLKQGAGGVLWLPGTPPPAPLLEHLAIAGVIEAWNVAFERWIWNEVMHKRHGWPRLERSQLRCAMAKARAWNLPGKLAKAGAVLQEMGYPVILKDKDGDRLLKKFSSPRAPTKKDPRPRIRPEDEMPDGARLWLYNLTDIASEASISQVTPDLAAIDLEFWKVHETINDRGVQIDLDAVKNAIAILEQGYARYNAEIKWRTNGMVEAITEAEKIKNWINLHLPEGCKTESIDDDNLTLLLESPHLAPYANALRVLEIRQIAGGAAVKKVYAMAAQVTEDQRLHDLFVFSKARTGRSAGEGPQPQNLFKGGPSFKVCEECKGYYVADIKVMTCPHCGLAECFSEHYPEWERHAAEAAIGHLKYQSFEYIERIWGNPFFLIAACLRALFIPKPGHDFLCVDFNAIEAIVLAALAGEEWRLEVFRTHGKIYEMSASKITGMPFEDYTKYKAEHGSHHPTRNKVGKVAELACLRGDALVLTRRGWVPICRVKLIDEIWDGAAWVVHSGVVRKGLRKDFTPIDGLPITAQHLVWVEGERWVEAQYVAGTGEQWTALETGAILRPPGEAWHFDQEYKPCAYGESAKVYDILNCGPDNRFMVKTNTGFLLVHNSGYQGWIGSWKAFGADEFFTDEEIKANVLAWRDASPAIVALWANLENCAHAAVNNPGERYEYRQIGFFCHQDVLYMVLPSGRHLAYHQPRIGLNARGKPSLSYMANNTNPKYGKMGWVRMETWGGRLTENATQAVSNDLLRLGMTRAEARGYPLVLHVHDEVVAEVPEGTGSVEELEAILIERPPWAHDWPIRASGGWRGTRYGK
jgi:hypothetical protein